ncbi:hypothetical protein SAMN02745975_03199 [Geosporobacter subterraneus DSM 17957]|uniref:Uncharacterized protein n=1 Tax=Geosporobacter subterraneus DSM 17957 TaxID=1121919 RepID=A0A1M6N540_9FIRM|nr:hypothetical protein [Geosporobacter subterraneus]SHJ90817.1 hypothetical protein SAMN02745975_03199 [Geosporobacter subterraneus DSM 17957]
MKKIDSNAKQALGHFKEEMAIELGADSFVEKHLTLAHLDSKIRTKVEEAYTHLGRS